MALGVLLRCAGWNLSRAIATLKKRGMADLRDIQVHFRRLLGYVGCPEHPVGANRFTVLAFLYLQTIFIRPKAA